MYSKLSKSPLLCSNRYFSFPFLVWVIAGAAAMLWSNQEQLFYMVNAHHNPTIDVLIYYTNFLGDARGLAIGLVCLCVLGLYRNVRFIGFALLCLLFPAVITRVLKYLFDHHRPLDIYEGRAWLHIEATWPHLHLHSFPSGHTTGAFSFFLLASACVQQKAWGLVFFLLSLVVAYGRLYMGAHFFADVYVGSIVGVLGCAFVGRLYGHKVLPFECLHC